MVDVLHFSQPEPVRSPSPLLGVIAVVGLRLGCPLQQEPLDDIRVE